MTIHKNNNCDGGRCTSPNGEVRVYPLGGGGNLILCQSCWAHENKYRFERGKETGEPSNFPQQDWYRAEIYNNEPEPSQKTADKIDGYDRDDLGESPDY
jgi:hypothetical protein